MVHLIYIGPDYEKKNFYIYIYIYSPQGYGEDIYIYMAPVSHYYVKCLGQRLCANGLPERK